MQEFFEEIISYHDLINGNLVPNKINTSALAEYLDGEQLSCQDMILGQFKEKNNKFELVEEFRICSAHPLAETYFKTNEIPFPNPTHQILDSDILKQLKIKPSNLNNSVYYRKQESLQTVGVSIDAEWNEIEENRLKYCYINTLLNEMESQHINAIRQLNIAYSHNDFKSRIYRLQRILQSYLNEIIEKCKLKSSDLKIKVKKTYNDKDCAVLTYKSIVVVLDFISTTYYEYIDPNQNIPYYSKLLNQNEFVSQAKQILKKINKIEIDDRLRLIIEAELRKVLHFEISKRITYLEFEYYKRLLKCFNKYLEKMKFEDLEQEDLINFLISISFKKQSFFEYCISRLKQTLKDFEDYDIKENFLKIKKKEYQQLQLHSYQYLNSDDLQLVVKFIGWIDLELDFINTDKKVIKRPVTITKKSKLVTTFNGKELGALMKILMDAEVFKPESKVELAKWIQDSITNENKHTYSLDSIRNNLYPPSKENFKRLRDLAIYILDVTNQSKG